MCKEKFTILMIFHLLANYKKAEDQFFIDMFLFEICSIPFRPE